MQAKPLATNLGEQANKIAVSVQSGDGDVLALWGMCRRYAMQQATRWLRAFESSGGVELDDLEQSAFSVTSMLCISSLTDTPDRSATKEKCVPC